jgi:ubiquinone/menaquinone biosynthesis C-methylase UbiE
MDEKENYMESTQTEESLAKSFNNLAEQYDGITDDFTNNVMEYITQENLMKELPIPSEKLKILDLGGGTGKYSLFLSKLGYTVTLLDISDKSLNIAKNKFIKENININIINAFGENTPFNKNEFDIIIMTGGVINYTPNPLKLLSECKRIIKNDGILYFDFTNTIGWANEMRDANFRLELLLSEEKLVQMPDWDYPERVFNYKYMEEMVENEGFKIINKYGITNLITSLPFEVKFKNVDEELLESYKKIELELSRNKECYGTSCLCGIFAKRQNCA